MTPGSRGRRVLRGSLGRMITFPCLAWKPLLHGSSLHSWPGGPAVGGWGDQLEGRACPPEAPPGVPAAIGQSPGPPDCVGGVPAGLGVPTCPSALRHPQRWLAALWRGYYSCPGGSQLKEKGLRPGEVTHCCVGMGRCSGCSGPREREPGAVQCPGDGMQVLTGAGYKGSPACLQSHPRAPGSWG